MRQTMNTRHLLTISASAFVLVTTLLLGQSLARAQPAQLVFRSGFNDDVRVEWYNYGHRLMGTDQVTSFTWPDDLPGDNSHDYFNFIVSDPGSNYLPFVDAKIVDTTGPGGTPVHALYMDFKQDDPNKVSLSRSQYNMVPDRTSSDPVQNLMGMYFRYDVKWDFQGHDQGWQDFVEYKASPSATQGGEVYRISLYIYGLQPNETPYWYLQGQYMEGSAHPAEKDWTYANHSVPVPENEWGTLEIHYFLSQDPDRGFYRVAFNGQIIFDHHGRTITELYPNPVVEAFNYFKVYCPTPQKAWITNYEIWDKPPAGSVLSDEEPQSCSDLGGTCCEAGQICEGGSFRSSSDCGQLCCVGGTCANKPQPEPKEYKVKRITNKPTVDGILGEYADAPTIHVTYPDNGVEATYRFVWDQDALYAAVEVTDNDLQASETEQDGTLWDDDSVEIMFDTLHNLGANQGNDDFKIIVNALGTKGDWTALSDSGWNPSYEVAVVASGTVNDDSDTDQGYRIEMAIPWDQWGSTPPPKADDVWGLEVVLNDKPGGSDEQGAWSNANGGTVNDPDGWGTMTFSDEKLGESQCPDGETECNGTCVDLNSDDSHCGACDVACAEGRRCEQGRCVQQDEPDEGTSDESGCQCGTTEKLTPVLPTMLFFLMLLFQNLKRRK